MNPSSHRRRIYNMHPICRWRAWWSLPTGPGCISLAGRTGARRAYSSPVTNSPQDCLCTGSASYPVFVHRPPISPWACLPHPASRRRTCPLANLRLCEYLVSGLSPDWIRAMHGAHVCAQARASRTSPAARCWASNVPTTATPFDK